MTPNDDRPRTGDVEPTDDQATPEASRTDSGREAQPRSAGSTARDARVVERLERQNRQAEDAAAINPERAQGSGQRAVGGDEHERDSSDPGD